MKRIEFDIKSQEQIEEWLEEVEGRMSENDLNHIATIAFNLANMDEFIFGNDEVCDKFLNYQTTHYYGGALH